MLRAEYRERFGVEMPESVERAPPKKQELVGQLVSRLRSQYKASDPAGLSSCLSLVKTYLSNLINDPTNAKYRRIRRSNKAFMSRIAAFPPAEELLLTVGFEKTDEDWLALEGEIDGFLIGNALKFVDLTLQLL